jgi:hypothetical protein
MANVVAAEVAADTFEAVEEDTGIGEEEEEEEEEEEAEEVIICPLMPIVPVHIPRQLLDTGP